MAGKLMRYPADIIDASTDYFKIEILKNIKKGGGLTGLGGTTCLLYTSPSPRD